MISRRQFLVRSTAAAATAMGGYSISLAGKKLHLNSASYYWVGGKERTLFYRDPLFASLIIDPEQKLVKVKGRASTWNSKTPEEIGFFESARGNARRKLIAPKISDRTIRL